MIITKTDLCSTRLLKWKWSVCRNQSIVASTAMNQVGMIKQIAEFFKFIFPNTRRVCISKLKSLIIIKFSYFKAAWLIDIFFVTIDLDL